MASLAECAPGAVVRLNSGTERMTVRPAETARLSPIPPNAIVCVWFDADNELNEWAFDPRELTLVREASKP